MGKGEKKISKMVIRKKNIHVNTYISELFSIIIEQSSGGGGFLTTGAS